MSKGHKVTMSSTTTSHDYMMTHDCLQEGLFVCASVFRGNRVHSLSQQQVKSVLFIRSDLERRSMASGRRSEMH